MQSLVASVSCHASTVPLKSNHVESHGDKKMSLESKKPSFLPLKQNTNLVQKPVISTRPLQKPEIPACIEACDVSSLLDKFLEYELNQNGTANKIKDSSVALTPVSSPSHKKSCNLTEALNANKKPCESSPIGLTPPVSPPSNQSIPSAAKYIVIPIVIPIVPSTPVTTRDKRNVPPTSPTGTVNESKKQDRNTIIGTSMEKVTSNRKAPSNATIMNNIKNKTEMHRITRQNVSSKSKNDFYHGNKNVGEEPTTNCDSEQKTSSLQFLQEKEKKIPKSSTGSTVDKRVNDDGYKKSKRCYSSDDDDDNDEKDYYDYKRKKYYTRDECYWSTSEDESDGEIRQYPSRKLGRRENHHKRRHRSHSSSSDSDDNHSTSGKSRSCTLNYEQQRRKDAESKKENCIQKAPVYDIEMERKKNFKLDRSFKETATEKRKIVYIGNIEESMSKNDIWRRFREYGPIQKVTVHYRNDGDNYSFVTFVDSSSALEAIEKGNKDPDLKHLDICFGGRRKFCGGSYVDFDSNTSYLEEKQINGDVASSQSKTEEMDFDALLKMCQRKSR
ncbi:peroxisome proliferator-activated receptor gamma coactivator-related protein 1-like [Actinia tenebrosa]|uniref:Peroxisome proliferator-activated receptor gamma coactivator-related protein 1-like n=1 Tax=Actinia tenebrosa TaxID=6105 RepID=A0A6P8HEV2_ACTTE|nr:peroxisome proliferator-activated receptor gamma coactivator-related protein 1-like [Actinia tenebrosa]